MPPPGHRDDVATGIDAVAAVLHEVGAYRARLSRVLASLADRQAPLDSLIRDCGMSRKSVERILSAAGDDVTHDADGYALRTNVAASYASRFLSRPETVEAAAETEIADLVAAAPAAKERFDHIVATPDTASRRARWLDGAYDLGENRLLFLGDHDLTSLAAGIVNRSMSAAVVDVDEDLLAYIDGNARRLGLDIRCYYADIRFSLPPDVAGSADIVFTDPPYTPDGVALFARRAIESLRDREFGNVVMSYGFSERTPALGRKVQSALGKLGMVHEAILPGFNTYYGAQAIGSRSDLYVSRPTGNTPSAFPAPARGDGTNVYTRGPQSEEAAAAGAVTDSVIDAATAGGEVPLAGVVGDGTVRAGTSHARLATLFDTGLPRAWARLDGIVVLDLADDPGPWLLRALLAANARRLAVLVPNNHPDIATESGQRGLRELVGATYALRFRRGVPGSRHALVEAEQCRGDGAAPETALRGYALRRAHGSLAAAWREGLIRATRTDAGGALTKNEARARISEATARFPSRLVDIPRHRLRDLFAAMDDSVRGPGAER